MKTRAPIKALARQTLDSVSALNTGLAVLENRMTDQLQHEQRALAVPVAGLDAQTGQIDSEVRAVSESIAGLSDRLGRLQQQLIDIGNAVKAIQPAPPVGSVQSAGVRGTGER